MPLQVIEEIGGADRNPMNKVLNLPVSARLTALCLSLIVLPLQRADRLIAAVGVHRVRRRSLFSAHAWVRRSGGC